MASRPAVNAAVAVILAFVPVSATGGTDPATRCEADKVKTAGKYASCRLSAEAKAIKKGTAPDFSKCDRKLGDKWAQIESRAGGACPDSGAPDGGLAFVTDQIAAAALGVTNCSGGVLCVITSARVGKNSPQSIPGADELTTLSFDDKLWDTAGSHVGANNSRLEVTASGTYLITGHVAWETNATGRRGVSIARNGIETIASTTTNAISGNNTEQSLAVVWELVAGDFVELRVRQASGAPIEVLAGSSTSFGIVRVN